MKKSIIMLGVALVTLSATLSFTIKSERAPANEGKVVSTHGDGFALQDQDQWK